MKNKYHHITNSTQITGAWRSLFLSFLLSKKQENSIIKDTYTILYQWVWDFKKIRNIYFLLYVKEDISHTTSFQKQMLHCLEYIYNSCPQLEECSIEIRFAPSALRSLSQNKRATCVYLLTILHIHCVSSSIRFRIVVSNNIFHLLHVHAYIPLIDTAFTKRTTLNTSCTYTYAIDVHVSHFKHAMKKILLYDTYGTVKHFSIHWGKAINDIDKQKSIIQEAKILGFSPYQFWHFYKDHRQYSSSFLDSCYYMLPYLGLKLHNVRLKTVSWKQGTHGSTALERQQSAIGFHTNKMTWNTIDEIEELSLRCLHAAYSAVYIPQYLYATLGTHTISTCMIEKGLRTYSMLTATNKILPYHNITDYTTQGEFWV